MNPKISVIVPVYKVEQYLPQCIDSILAQTFTDFELLLIDDGSPDNSGRICDEYAAWDFRIRVFHKENGGVSSARNLGLDNARGEWIAFVDSDDWIDDKYLESFIGAGVSEDILFFVQGYCRVGENGFFKRERFFLQEDLEKTLIVNEILRYGSPWGKLFKRDIIENNGVRFDERISMSEDRLFLFNYLAFVENSRTIEVNEFAGYYYRDTLSSLTKRRYDWRQRLLCSKLIEPYVRIVGERFINKNQGYKKELIAQTIYSHRIAAIQDMFLLNVAKKTRLDALRLLFSDKNVLEEMKLLKNRGHRCARLALAVFPITFADMLLAIIFSLKK